MEQLEKFAKFIGEGKYKYDGIKIWKQRVDTSHGNYIQVYYSTEQLIEKFLKE